MAGPIGVDICREAGGVRACKVHSNGRAQERGSTVDHRPRASCAGCSRLADVVERDIEGLLERKGRFAQWAEDWADAAACRPVWGTLGHGHGTMTG